MKSIQNKIMTSQKAFIVHNYGLQHYKGKLLKFSSEYITFSINTNVGFLDGTTIIQMIFNLVLRYLKYFRCYRSHSDPYVGFQVLKVVDLNPLDNVLHITPQEKIHWG
jgi:hypothetical protein